MSQNDFDRQTVDSKEIRDFGIQGNNNITNIAQGDNNTFAQTFNHTEIFQIAVEAIKTYPFLAKSPYKGLKKFESEDKDRFFGRDQFLKTLVAELEQTNLVLLLGASGSGKSSVVRAGLIPWLDQQAIQWLKLTFTPDQDPFESLYRSLGSHYKQPDAQIAREARTDTLTQVVTTLRQPNSHWLIFVDQFEELFTTSQVEKRDRFIDSLVQLNVALKLLGQPKDCPVKIIATMRADFLDRLSPYPALVKATNQHRPMIAEMQSDELRMAIEQPVAHHGVVFETGLVDEIIKDVRGQAGYLPLLQYTLNLLWEQESQRIAFAQERTLRVETYRGLGGVRGALQEHVDQIHASLREPEKVVAQRVFLKLVEIGGDEEFGTEWKPVRRRALRSEFQDAPEEKVLTRLIDENLLVSDRRSQSQEATVEIAHEVLLTSWETLNIWIKENRQAIALRNRLNDDVVRWQMNKSEDELWTGSKLEKVLELRGDPTFNRVIGGFSSTANQFIDASLGIRDRIRKRQIRLARTIAGISIGAVVLVSITGTIAMFQRQEAVRQEQEAIEQKEQAERQAQVALAQQLIAKAEVARGQGSTQLQLSMLLAIEGVQRLKALGMSSAEGDAILRHGLDLLKAPVPQDSINGISAANNLRNIETAQQQNELCVGNPELRTRDCHSSDSMYVAQIIGTPGASGGSDTVDFPVQVIDASTKQLLGVLLHSGYVSTVSFLEGGRYAVSKSYGGDEVTYWYLGFGEGSAHLLTDITESKNLSNVFNSNVEEAIQNLSTNLENDKLSFRGKYVIRPQSNGWQLKDLATNEVILTLDPGSVAFSLDDQYVSSLSDRDSILRIYEINTGRIVFQESIELLSNNLQIKDDKLQDDELQDREGLRSSSFLKTLLDGFAIHNDNIYFYGQDGWYAFLWEINKNQLEVIPGLGGRVTSATLSERGRYIVIEDRFNVIQVVESDSRNLVMRLDNDGGGRSPYGGNSGVIFSPDEKYIAVISLGNVVRIFEVSTGQEIYRLEVGNRAILEYPGSNPEVNELAFSPDGRYLATKFFLSNASLSEQESSTSGILLWDLRTDNLILDACSRLTRNLLFSEWKQLFGDAPYQKTCSNLPGADGAREVLNDSDDSTLNSDTSSSSQLPSSQSPILPELPTSDPATPPSPSPTVTEKEGEVNPSLSDQESEKITRTPTRVIFESGSTRTALTGSITPNELKQYLLQCSKGQPTTVQIREGGVEVEIIAPDGQVIGMVSQTDEWQGELPSNGDYVFRVASSEPTSYVINVEILPP